MGRLMSCVNVEINVPASNKESAKWNVKERIGKSAAIDGVSVSACR
jgi:hypothetical protein